MKTKEKKEKTGKGGKKKVWLIIVAVVVILAIAFSGGGEPETAAETEAPATPGREYSCLVYEADGIAVDATHSANGEDGRIKKVKFAVYNDTDAVKQFAGWRTDVNGEWMATTGEATVAPGEVGELEITLEGTKADPSGSFDIVVIRLQIFDESGELLQEIELEELLFDA